MPYFENERAGQKRSNRFNIAEKEQYSLSVHGIKIIINVLKTKQHQNMRGSYMAEEKNKKGRLLALQQYMYQYTDEDHPATTQELIDEMGKLGYIANRKTFKDDIDILTKFDIDIVTNVSRGNSFFMGERRFELPEIKLLVDAVSSSRFISTGKSDALIKKISSMASVYQQEQIEPRILTADRIKTDNT